MTTGAFWKPILLPAAAIVFLALYPQLNLWIAKGSDWNGAYAVSNYDETAYSAYTNALIEGNGRKFDPFLLRPEPGESLYSIQFIPAYSIAVLARAFGLSASTSFILLGMAIALGAVLALYWLFLSITGDDTTSAFGTLIVLCFGTAVAFQGELRQLIVGDVLVDYLPFLRRYQPGLGFPLFFLFIGLLWTSFNATENQKRLTAAVAAGFTFAVLVFTYFYLWTAAGALLACYVPIACFLNRKGRREVLISSAVVALFAVIAMIPYALILVDRAANIDSVQLLIFSRLPNFSSPVLWFGLMIAGGFLAGAKASKIELASPPAIIALALSLTPVVLLNQQVITGRSLQPVHYELFVANYLVLIAGAIFIWLVTRNSGSRKAIVYLGIAALGWGIVEAGGSTARNADANLVRDESFAAFKYIANESRADSEAPVVHATNFVTADLIPTGLRARALWNSHLSSAGGIDATENMRLFYLYLYYSGYSERDLGQALVDNVFEVTSAVFGAERALPSLGQATERISDREIKEQVAKYSEFRRTFDTNRAAEPTLSYIIVPTDAEPDFTTLDHWYTRDEGHSFKFLKVYKLKLKSAIQ